MANSTSLAGDTGATPSVPPAPVSGCSVSIGCLPGATLLWNDLPAFSMAPRCSALSRPALSLLDPGGGDPEAKAAPLCRPGQKDASAWRGLSQQHLLQQFISPGPLGEEAERGALRPDPLFPELPSQIWPGPLRSFSPCDTSKRNAHIHTCTKSVPAHQNHSETCALQENGARGRSQTVLFRLGGLPGWREHHSPPSDNTEQMGFSASLLPAAQTRRKCRVP